MNWQSLVAVALMIFALNPAIQYGGIWNLRANPVPGVVVALRDGQRVSGKLTREWSKDWMVLTPDGGAVRFTDRDYQSMQFSAPVAHAAPDPTWWLLRAWRSFLPFSIVSAACLWLFATSLASSWSTFASRRTRLPG